MNDLALLQDLFGNSKETKLLICTVIFFSGVYCEIEVTIVTPSLSVFMKTISKDLSKTIVASDATVPDVADHNDRKHCRNGVTIIQ